MPIKKAPAIGINLGTTYSSVAVFQNGGVKYILNDQGSRTTPSCVAFTDFARLVGDAAKSQAEMNPESTIFNVKRLIGRKYDDPKIKEDLKHWPFKVINHKGKVKIQVQFKREEKLLNPEEISALVLTKLKMMANAHLGLEVTDAVITVPAFFNDSQRQATIDAGKIAGLNVLELINEPTAAALAYRFSKNLQDEKNVLIYKLGGGTFDVSILTIDKGSTFTVRSTAGDTHLGGEDFDNILVNHFKEIFKGLYQKDISTNPRAMRRLRTACEEAKQTLSSSEEARIKIDALFEGINFYSKITKETFEELCFDLFNSTESSVKKAMTDAKLEGHNIHDVVLVGGSTRIPRIQTLLSNLLLRKKLCTSFTPDKDKAYGAAIKAAILTRSTNKLKDVSLVDVAPLSIFIKNINGYETVINRNSSIPCNETVEIRMQPNCQPCIVVYEGEVLPIDNHPLGSFRLLKVPLCPEEKYIEVIFKMDSNGILNIVSDKKSENQQMVTIPIPFIADKGRLSEKEIEEMLNEAKQYEIEERNIEMETATAINNLEKDFFK